MRNAQRVLLKAEKCQATSHEIHLQTGSNTGKEPSHLKVPSCKALAVLKLPCQMLAATLEYAAVLLLNSSKRPSALAQPRAQKRHKCRTVLCQLAALEAGAPKKYLARQEGSRA